MSSSLSATEETILTALSAGELYGLDILRLIQENGGTISTGTLYSTLKRLEEDTLVSGRGGENEQREKGGAKRRYYSLTSEGRSLLEAVRGLREGLYYRKKIPNKVSEAAIAEVAKQVEDAANSFFGTSELTTFVVRPGEDAPTE